MILPFFSLPLLSLFLSSLFLSPLFLPFWACKTVEDEKPGLLMRLEAWASRLLIVRDAWASSDDTSLGI